MDGIVIYLLPMTRRSFMGSMLALAAAPAIVRASSIMQVQSSNWRRYVREVIYHDFSTDAYIARWDILAPGLGQYHVDSKFKILGENELTRDSMFEHERNIALETLDIQMRHCNISPRALVKLELPQSIDWARHLG